VAVKLRQLGLHFDWHEEQTAKLILGKRADGLYATAEASANLSLPRQTGKTFSVGGLVVSLCLLTPNTLALWTAHVLRTSNMTYSKMRLMCSRPQIRPFVDHMRLANGEGEIGFTNNSKIMFGARDRGFGLGFDNVDILVFDEAQRLNQTALDDMVPTTAVARNPLVLLCGTPPRPNDSGDAFRMRRDEALSGRGEGLLWVEFGADEGVDPLTWTDGFIDWEQVAKANPLYPSRVSKSAVRRLKKNLGPESFAREGLGLWDLAEQIVTLIPRDQWAEQTLRFDGPQLPESQRIYGDVVAGVHVTQNRQLAYIALCGARGDGGTQVEIADVVAPIEVAGWLEKRSDRIKAVTGQTHGAGATSELVNQLANDRTFHIAVEDWAGAELPAAHGRALDALRLHQVTTPLNDALDASVACCVGKELGGGVVVDIKKSSGEPAPLMAWIAAYGLWTRPRQTSSKIPPAEPVAVPVMAAALAGVNVSKIGF